MRRAWANVYAVWKLIFGSDAYGYLNGVLLSSGITLQNIRWLEDVNYIMPCIIIVLLWGSLGVSFLSFIAGLQNVDRTLYDAGALDGVKIVGRSFGILRCRICDRS